jgi:hypothetical protein
VYGAVGDLHRLRAVDFVHTDTESMDDETESNCPEGKPSIAVLICGVSLPNFMIAIAIRKVQGHTHDG